MNHEMMLYYLNERDITRVHPYEKRDLKKHITETYQKVVKRHDEVKTKFSNIFTGKKKDKQRSVESSIESSI